MKTIVRHIETGKTFEVEEKFSGSLSIQGEIFFPKVNKTLHTDWYVRKDEVTATVKGERFVVTQMSEKMQEAVDADRREVKEKKERIEMYKRSQMFTY